MYMYNVHVHVYIHTHTVYMYIHMQIHLHVHVQLYVLSFSLTAPQELTYINHLPHDFYDMVRIHVIIDLYICMYMYMHVYTFNIIDVDYMIMYTVSSQGGDTVKLKIQLAHLNKQKCRVIFQDRSLELQFQTRLVEFFNLPSHYFLCHRALLEYKMYCTYTCTCTN